MPCVDYDKCIGCMACVSQCPGLAIFGYDPARNFLFLPVEYEVREGAEVFLVDNSGQKRAEGILDKLLKRPNKTNVARIQVTEAPRRNDRIERLYCYEDYPAPVQMKETLTSEGKTFRVIVKMCHWRIS